MIFLTGAQTRQVEEAAFKLGFSHLRLMENAGSAAARIIREHVDIAEKRVSVICGRGNNGGDGLVVARKFFEARASVNIILAGGLPKTPDATEMYTRAVSLGIPVIDFENDPQRATLVIQYADILVDAILGIGTAGVLNGGYAELVRFINRVPAKTFALDMPSGANPDTGEVEGECVRADVTVSFNTLKPGQMMYPAAHFCGELVTASIGLPEEALRAVESQLVSIDEGDVRPHISKHSKDIHKGCLGRALLICGSLGMAGAAELSARAAVRCGAGLVEVACPKSIYVPLASRLAEPIFDPLPETEEGTLLASAFETLRPRLTGAGACLIGCGLRKSIHTAELVYKVLEHADCPVVIDADGINSICGNIHILKSASAPVILTPHPGEMARLLNTDAEEVQASRLHCARDFAKAYKVILILKGANTVIALPSGKAFINRTGNPGMAKGGSGDVLAGMLASFLAQGLAPETAAVTAVYLHGLAGDKAAALHSEHAMTPGDIIAALPAIFLAWEAKSAEG